MIPEEEMAGPIQIYAEVAVDRYVETDILTKDDKIRAQNSLSTQKYDAFVLFADDIKTFATEMMEMLTIQYDLKFCVKDDLIVEEEFKHDAVLHLISKRCHKLVVIISQALFDDNYNKCYYAHAQKEPVWYKGTKYPKAIPCLYTPCQIPPEISGVCVLDYGRVDTKIFYDKLSKSIQPSGRSVSQSESGSLTMTTSNSNSRTIKEKRDWFQLVKLKRVKVPAILQEETHSDTTMSHKRTDLSPNTTTTTDSTSSFKSRAPKRAKNIPAILGNETSSSVPHNSKTSVGSTIYSSSITDKNSNRSHVPSTHSKSSGFKNKTPKQAKNVPAILLDSSQSSVPKNYVGNTSSDERTDNNSNPRRAKNVPAILMENSQKSVPSNSHTTLDSKSVSNNEEKKDANSNHTTTTENSSLFIAEASNQVKNVDQDEATSHNQNVSSARETKNSAFKSGALKLAQSIPVALLRKSASLIKKRYSETPPVLSLKDLLRITDSAGLIERINYREMKRATNNWTTQILGKGGYGTVFMGKWIETDVAIKRIEQRKGKKGKEQERSDTKMYEEQIKQCATELRWLNAFRHDNILNVYGYGISGSHTCLVYQYMAGGCLDKRLREKDNDKVLSWSKRLRIAVLTARGLQFLHTARGKPLIHGDIKSANILLDANDEPRIGDFGLAQEGAKLGTSPLVLEKICGTAEYIPRDFAVTHQLITKVDTYSFGVVLFEIATGLKACVSNRAGIILTLRYHVLNYKGDIYDLHDGKLDRSCCFESLISIGKLCVGDRAEDRPEMVEVFRLLQDVKLDEKYVLFRRVLVDQLDSNEFPSSDDLYVDD